MAYGLRRVGVCKCFGFKASEQGKVLPQACRLRNKVLRLSSGLTTIRIWCWRILQFLLPGTLRPKP